MIWNRAFSFLAAAVLAFLASTAFGQQPYPEDPLEPLPPRPRPPARATGEIPDPTLPSPGLREVLGPAVGPAGSTPTALPVLGLKGRVIRENEPGSALIEMGGYLYIVRPSAELGYNGLTLKVRSIDASEVLIDVEPLKRVISLR